jgi:hypothetical protein
VVGQGEGVEPEPLGLVDEVSDASEAVEERELGVDVEVREVSGTEGRHGRSMVARRARRAGLVESGEQPL